MSELFLPCGLLAHMTPVRDDVKEKRQERVGCLGCTASLKGTDLTRTESF